jgi:CDP-glucose 4,6-dehydratase
MLSNFIQETRPEIVIHMAAQPLVRESYRNPVETYSTNVMGTVNLLEAVKLSEGVKAVINVTTDKCYDNREWHWGYRENDSLGGYDPYSNSKACSELVTSAYRTSFFNMQDFDRHGVGLASARAGNVIGGGDWAEDRLFADFARSISKGQKLQIRNPHSIRPWQHVLEPLTGYLMLAHRLYSEGARFADAWNFGPDDADAKDVEWITKTVCDLWGSGVSYEVDINPQPHEASYLKLDCSRARAELGWLPKWTIRKALQSIVEWNKAWLGGSDLRKTTIAQIKEYLS